MSGDVDAVIAALRVALEEAQKSEETFWKVRAANRWINQLPGAWLGRWRHLRLAAAAEYGSGIVERDEFIGHVRAALAYLETNREAIRSMRAWSWPPRGPQAARADPIDAEFQDVAQDRHEQLSKLHKPVRLIK